MAMTSAPTPTPTATVPSLDLSDPRVAEAIASEVARVLATAAAVPPAPPAAPPAAPPGDTPAWDRPVAAKRRTEAVPAWEPAAVEPGRVPTVAEAIEAWIAGKKFSPSTAKGARQHRLSERAKGWRAHHGVKTIDQLTAAQAAAYLAYLEDRGAEPATLRKVKTLFSSLGKFCRATPGYTMGLAGDELHHHQLPALVDKNIPALSEEECERLIAACENLRDRMIVETLLITGVRVSELCALTLDVVHLDRRPAHVAIVGSVHNPKRPKTPKQREIPVDYDKTGFGRGYVQRLRQYIEQGREHTYRRELFLTHRRDAELGQRTGLTRDGVERLMDRLEARTGIHCNPHKLRHTFATRLVDRNLNMFDLADMLGHESLDMVRRYFARNLKRRAENLARAFDGSRAGAEAA